MYVERNSFCRKQIFQCAQNDGFKIFMGGEESRSSWYRQESVNLLVLPGKSPRISTAPMMRVIHVVGARPNYMKVAPIMRAMRQRPDFWEQILVHTGQHYDQELSEVFFPELGLPPPDVYLGTGSGSHAEQYARVLQGFESVLKQERPQWVIVVGDVNSTLACALAATQARVQVAHVEAGLRSFDRSMPEEINRVLTDHLSTLLFTSEPCGAENLRREGIEEEKIRFVGNTMIDSLVAALPRTQDGRAVKELGLWDTHRPNSYVLVTLHRPSNVDSSVELARILEGLAEVSSRVPVVFPVHPRTRLRLESTSSVRLPTQIRLLPPVGYVDFLTLERHASLVITDSGGIQEETTYLRVPCLTVRPNTERPITLLGGQNRLIKPSEIPFAVDDVLSMRPVSTQPPPLWDGHSAERIVKHLESQA